MYKYLLFFINYFNLALSALYGNYCSINNLFPTCIYFKNNKFNITSKYNKIKYLCFNQSYNMNETNIILSNSKDNCISNILSRCFKTNYTTEIKYNQNSVNILNTPIGNIYLQNNNIEHDNTIIYFLIIFIVFFNIKELFINFTNMEKSYDEELEEFIRERKKSNEIAREKERILNKKKYNFYNDESSEISESVSSESSESFDINDQKFIDESKKNE